MAMAQRRTDLAVEAHELWREGAGETTKLSGVRAEDGQREGFSTTVVTVLDQEGAAALGKPVGRYVTLELDGLVRREEDAFQRAVRAVAGEVEAMAPRAGTVLVMGLGNRAVTPDLIGPLAAEHVLGNPLPCRAFGGALWTLEGCGGSIPRCAGLHWH